MISPNMAFQKHSLPTSSPLKSCPIQCLISSAHSYSGSAIFASKVPRCLFEIWMIKEGDHCALHNAEQKPVGSKYFSSRPRAKDGGQRERRGQSLPRLHLIDFLSDGGARFYRWLSNKLLNFLLWTFNLKCSYIGM